MPVREAGTRREPVLEARRAVASLLVAAVVLALAGRGRGALRPPPAEERPSPPSPQERVQGASDLRGKSFVAAMIETPDAQPLANGRFAGRDGFVMDAVRKMQGVTLSVRAAGGAASFRNATRPGALRDLRAGRADVCFNTFLVEQLPRGLTYSAPVGFSRVLVMVPRWQLPVIVALAHHVSTDTWVAMAVLMALAAAVWRLAGARARTLPAAAAAVLHFFLTAPKSGLWKENAAAARLLVTGSCFYALVITSLFQAIMVDNLTQIHYIDVLSTLEDLAASGVELVAADARLEAMVLRQRGGEWELLRRHLRRAPLPPPAGKAEGRDGPPGALAQRRALGERLARDKDFALLLDEETRAWLVYELQLRMGDEAQDHVVTLDAAVATFLTAYVVRAGSPLAEGVSAAVGHLAQAGLLRRWHQQSALPPHAPASPPAFPVAAIVLSDLPVVFCGLLFVYAAAGALLLAELAAAAVARRPGLARVWRMGRFWRRPTGTVIVSIPRLGRTRKIMFDALPDVW